MSKPNAKKAKLQSVVDSDLATPKGESKRARHGYKKKFDTQKPGDKGIKFGMNDVTWYLKYPELARDVANIAQNYIPGIAREVFFGDYDSGNVKLAVPAGLSLKLIITPGMADTATDGFNMSMKSMWLQMHRKYRGIGTYQSADLGAVIFSILAVFAFIAEGERAYGVCAHYEARNRMIPSAYERVLNWDFTGLRTDLANFRYQLNRIIKKASILCLPKGLPAFEDVIQMFSNLFKDRETIRSQVFAGVQAATWEYDPTSINTGSAVKGTIVAAPWNNSSYLLRLEAMVDALVQDDDVARICSDIIACFENDIQTLLPLPEDYTVTPVYHEVRSLQMHNLRCPNANYKFDTTSNKYAAAYHTGTTGVTGGDGLWVYQEDNIIKFRTYRVEGNAVSYYSPSGTVNNTPYSAVTASTLAAGPLCPGIYDIWKDAATQDDILEMTRLASVGEVVILPASVSAGKEAVTLRITHGLYIVHDVSVIYTETDSAGLLSYATFNFIQTESSGNMYPTGNVMASGIDNAPMCFTVDKNGDFNNGGQFMVFGGVDNLIFINNMELEHIHDVCVLSEYQFSNTLIK